MKLTAYFAIFFFSILALSSCSKFDNYDAPEETVKGVVINKNTGKPLQTQMGEDGLRIKMMEYSWSDTPTPYYFGGMQEGNFQNTRIFEGQYGITIMGAFVPVPEEIYTVKGIVDIRLEVEPFLDIEWVDEPVINSDKTVTVKAIIKRGTSNPDYQQKVDNVRFFVVAGAPYVGDNNYDDRYSVFYSGDEANDMVDGKVHEFTTKLPLPSGYTFHFRVGARMDKDIEGTRRYNYNEIKTLLIP